MIGEQRRRGESRHQLLDRAARARRRIPRRRLERSEALERADVARCRPRVSGRRAGQHGVLDEDRPLELLQLDARLEAELVAQALSRPPVDLESLRLPSAAVEREHQLRGKALPERMLGGERLELRDERQLATERELCIDPLLDRRQTKLLEALDLDARERLELEIGERPPLPQALGRTQRVRRGGEIAGRARLTSLCDEPLEALEVELAGLDAQQVAGRAGDQARLVAGRRTERLPQPRNLVTERVVGRVGALPGEELADQSLPRDDAVGIEQEERQQRPLLRSSNRDRHPVHPHDERTEDPELEAARDHSAPRVSSS